LAGSARSKSFADRTFGPANQVIFVVINVRKIAGSVAPSWCGRRHLHLSSFVALTSLDALTES